MSATEQQSLNAVKAALANARTRDAAGSMLAAPGEQPFVCAKVGLRINDLAAVVALAESVEALTVLELRARLEAAESLVADQLELLTEQAATLDACRDAGVMIRRTADGERWAVTNERAVKAETALDAARGEIAELREGMEIIERGSAPGGAIVNKRGDNHSCGWCRGYMTPCPSHIAQRLLSTPSHGGLGPEAAEALRRERDAYKADADREWGASATERHNLATRVEAAEKQVEALETEGEQLIGEVASLKRRAEAAEKERDSFAREVSAGMLDYDTPEIFMERMRERARRVLDGRSTELPAYNHDCARDPRFRALESRLVSALAAYEAMREGLTGLLRDEWMTYEGNLEATGHASVDDLERARALLASESPGREWLREWGMKVAHHAWRLGFFRGREYEEMNTLEAMRRADEFSLTNEAASALVESLLPEGGR